MAGGMVITMKPEYPIKVLFKEDGEEWFFENKKDIAQNLEWFDSDDPSENAIVTDKNGRQVTLKVEKLEVLTFELTHRVNS